MWLTLTLLGGAVAIVCSWVIARTIAPAAGPLATETLWRLDHVLLGMEKVSPADIYAYHRSPHIFFTPLSDYKGDDGCNAYHGLYRDEGNGGIEFYFAEHTLKGCDVVLPNANGQIVTQPRKPKFLDVILSVTSYEVNPGELRLNYGIDEPAIMVFYPTNEPYEFFPLGILRWECANTPILWQVLGSWCRID